MAASTRHTISLSPSNNEYALKQATKMFDGKLSTYLNYILNKEREKEKIRSIKTTFD